jgi:hypothetical protein
MWCKEHGVDAFPSDKFGKASPVCKRFATNINEQCMDQGQITTRTATMVSGVIDNATRRKTIVPHRPIRELFERAEQMRKELKKGETVADDLRFSAEAIPIPENDGAGDE